MNAVTSHLYDQFRKPRGPLGHVAGRIMSKRSSNVERSRWTVEQLGLARDASVLEVGYGPGLGLEAALAAVPDGSVVGLDHSATMRSSAAKRNRAALDAGRLDVLVGDAQVPPPGLGPFDAIFSCNVWLFWSDQVGTLRALAGLLRPGGQLAVTHLPRHEGASAAAADEAASQIETQMRQIGLVAIDRRVLDLEPVPAVCVIGHSEP